MHFRVGVQFNVDRETANYLQRHSFVDGPDSSYNRQLTSNLRRYATPQFAPTADAVCHELHGHPRELLTPEEWERLAKLGQTLGLAKATYYSAGYYYGWKLKLANTKPRRVLSFGTGRGVECVAIKAVFPEAKQSAMDMNLKLNPSWHEALSIEATYRTQLESINPGVTGMFDLIFSNHTLEHLADPELALKRLMSLLEPGGTLVCAVPIEWSPESVVRKAVERLESNGAPHPLEVSDLYLGHLWKTSARGVAAALERAGFERIGLYQRVDYPTGWRNHDPMHRSLLEWRAKIGATINTCTLLPFRRVLMRLFPEQPPKWVLRNYFRLEHRLWFSNFLLHNSLVRELAFTATRPLHSRRGSS